MQRVGALNLYAVLGSTVDRPQTSISFKLNLWIQGHPIFKVLTMFTNLIDFQIHMEKQNNKTVKDLVYCGCCDKLRDTNSVFCFIFSVSIYKSVYSVRYVRGGGVVVYTSNMTCCCAHWFMFFENQMLRIMSSFNNGEDYTITSAIMP